MNPMLMIRKLSSPPTFIKVSASASLVLLVLGVVLALLGFTYAFIYAPTDAQQGEVYRILFIHVPAAWMSMFLYILASFYALIHWIYRTKVSAVMMRSLLPTGAWMTLLALVTGALWGKSTWGTYWVWDARLTSELLLLFIYIGLMAFASMIEDESKTDRVLALLILVGLVNIPLIYFSVIFWNTLHQGASLGVSGSSRMAMEMKLTLLICTLSVWMVCAAMVLARARLMLLWREAQSVFKVGD
jgi:heme exporter protein C